MDTARTVGQDKMFMKNETLHQSLMAIKCQGYKLEMIVNFPPKKIIKTMVSWPECFMKWESPEDPMPFRMEDQFEWLWDGVVINEPKMMSLLGSNASELFYYCYKANFIFPDGTYNMEAIDVILKNLN